MRPFFNSAVIIIMAVLIFVVFPLYWEAYPSPDLAGKWFSAFIGSVVTYFLLTMQSKGMVERERLAEVFKERLDIYQNFLKKLYDIVEDKQLEDKEFLDLQFQLSYIAMHTDRKRLGIIQKHTFEIIRMVCAGSKTTKDMNREGKEDPLVKEGKEDPLVITHLYEIICQMQAQLYEKNEMKPLNKGAFSGWEKWKEGNEKEVKELIDKDGVNLSENKTVGRSITHVVDDETLKKIGLIFSSPRENENAADHHTPHESDEKKAAEQWKTSLEKKYEKRGWKFEFESDGFQIRSDDKHNGHVGIRYNADTGLYSIFANYWKNGVNQSEFSKPMKWDFGGTRSYGAWGVPLNSTSMGIKTPIELGKLYTCLMSDAVQPKLLEKMDLIVDHLEKHNRSVEWMLALKNDGLDEEKWGTGVWYWDDMVCTALQEHPKFGKFRIGVKANEKEIELILENTEFNHDKLVEALKCIGLEEVISRIHQGSVVKKEPIKEGANLATEIAKRVKGITDAIDNKKNAA